MITRKSLLILLLVTLFSVGLYIGLSAVIYRVGFPLDDSWIHQTYARNLAQKGQWAFIPGQITSGSTAPVWTILLSVGYLVHLSPYIWTYFLGWMLLFLLSILSELIIRRQVSSYTTKLPWAGMVLAIEWHFVWAAGSGMEVLLLADAFLLIVHLLLDQNTRWWLVGLVVGISIWIRPESITWLGPVVIIIFFQLNPARKKFRDFFFFCMPLFLSIGFYVLFNFLLTGNLLTNTFYAKQIEYKALTDVNLIIRFFRLSLLPLQGLGAILLPGFFYTIYLSIKTKSAKLITLIIWIFGFEAMYAVILPVTYQYGRYLMPMMSVFFVIGLIGFFQILGMQSIRKWTQILKRVWILSLVAIAAIYFTFGAYRYSMDVAIIESEMVDTAKWVKANTTPNALIAAHDIGALGYFGERRIIDLAGLINPEVIPIIRNEEALTNWLDMNGADYLVTFPDWYTYLTSGKSVIHQGDHSFSIKQDGTKMTVYKWSSDK